MAPLTRLSVGRPILMLMSILLFVIFGLQSFLGMNVENLPATDLPIVTISVVWSGASPEDVADNLIEPIEEAISGLSGISRISASAQENFGLVVVEFVDSINGDQATIDVDRAVSSIRSNLPDDIQEPKVEQRDPNAAPILFIVLSGPQGADALAKLAEDDLKPQIQSTLGVAAVTISGGRERQIQVNTNPTKLSAFGLPLSSVGDALKLENVSVAAGSIDNNDESIAVRSVGEFETIEDIENVVVGTAFGTLPLASSSANDPDFLLNQLGLGGTGLIFMRDVATVIDTYEAPTRKVRLNGKEAVLLAVTKSSDANAVEVANAVKQIVADLQSTLPAGANLEVVIDDTLFTEAAVEGVQGDLIAAIVITGLVLLFFLHTINSAAIVVITVPVALAITFLGMAAFGFTLNTLTLLALTVAIGSLVDDSIVITENTERHTQMKKSPKQAAFDATTELGFTSLATTLVGVIVYIPVALLSGTIGQFFFPYGITVTIAFAVSLFLAFSLTPLLASWWMPDTTKPDRPARGLARISQIVTKPIVWVWFKIIIRVFETFFTALANGYRSLLRLALASGYTQLVVLIITGVAVYGGVGLITSGAVPFGFIPYQDDAKISVTIEMPVGTSLEATDRATRRTEDIIRNEVPEVGLILTTVGAETSSATNNSKNFANITVVLTDKRVRSRNPLEVVESLRPHFALVPGAKVTAIAGNQDVIDIDIFAPDPITVVLLAEEIRPLIESVPGANDVRTPGIGQTLQEELVIDRGRAKELGLSSGQIAGTLRTAINGSTEGTFQPEGTTEKIDIILRMTEDSRNDLSQIMQLPLAYVSDSPVRVGQVAEVQSTLVSARIERENRQFSVTFDITPSGRGSTDIANDILSKLEAYNFSPGASFGLGPASSRSSDSMTQLVGAFGFSLLLIYILMVGLYESFLQPIAVMSALPVSLVGAVGGLYLTGLELNIISMLGIIMLAGLVTKNAILLLDLTNTLRDEGLSRKEALIQAGHQRLRAILMTALSLVFALIPLLINDGLGSELRTPMAAVVIGGTLVSVGFFIFLVPVVYNLLDVLGLGFSWIVRTVIGLGEAEDEQTPPPNQPSSDDNGDRPNLKTEPVVSPAGR
ncbi:efflux RND transporter permease subunit [Anaerolineales bacterium HSG6]|nr:efflux RND transporter permease subunit [Anaerolineales bacterium HSG6]